MLNDNILDCNYWKGDYGRNSERKDDESIYSVFDNDKLDIDINNEIIFESGSGEVFEKESNKVV